MSTCNAESPTTEEQPPALTTTGSLNEVMHDATDIKTDNTGMMDGQDQDADGSTVLSSDQVSGSTTMPVGSTNKVVSCEQQQRCENGDVNVSEGVKEGDAECRHYTQI